MTGDSRGGGQGGVGKTGPGVGAWHPGSSPAGEKGLPWEGDRPPQEAGPHHIHIQLWEVSFLSLPPTTRPL